MNFPPYKLYIYHSLDDVEIVWKTFEKRAYAHVYQLFNWAKTWDSEVGTPAGYQLHIVEIRDLNGDTLMLVPLCYQTNSIGTVVSFIGEDMFDYLGPLIYEDFARQTASNGFDLLWKDITATFDFKVDLIWLDRLPASIDQVPNPFVSLDGFSFESNANALDFPEAQDWHQCARLLRSNKTIKKIERRIRSLEKTGPVELLEITQTQSRRKHMAELIAMKVKNLNDTRTLHKFDSLEISAFYDAIVSNLESHENVLQFELRCGDKLIASVFAMAHQQIFSYQICAFNREEFGQYSPGTLLMYRLLDWSFSNGFKRFDMTIGDESYKYDWINNTVPLKTVAVSYSVVGKLVVLKRRVARWMKSQIKQSPIMRKLIFFLLKR